MVLKFFLHMSADEQKDRFKRRIELPDHNWKFSSADIKERRYFNDYQKHTKTPLSIRPTRPILGILSHQMTNGTRDSVYPTSLIGGWKSCR